jgi:hypothetical protein
MKAFTLGPGLTLVKDGFAANADKTSANFALSKGKYWKNAQKIFRAVAFKPVSYVRKPSTAVGSGRLAHSLRSCPSRVGTFLFSFMFQSSRVLSLNMIAGVCE